MKISTPMKAKGVMDASRVSTHVDTGQPCLWEVITEEIRYRMNRTPCPIPIGNTSSRLMKPSETLKIANRDSPSSRLAALKKFSMFGFLVVFQVLNVWLRCRL